MPEEVAYKPLRLGSKAPNFQADTTIGRIDFYEWIGNDWVILFSHPEDYTPVCTTELADLAKHQSDFAKRGVKLIGLSANSIESHDGWINDITELAGCSLTFPVIGDEDRRIAHTYDMLDHQDTTNVDARGIAYTIRSVFIIDPNKVIRLIQAYPASTGRSTTELLRVVDSLLAADKYSVNTPANWEPGDDVVVPAGVADEEAQVKFPNMQTVKPYLRFTPLAKEHIVPH
ncbi:mitochondrial peroxiredoxin PRX1 [Aspergillus udagawae]|uniref:Mitochondrial peroxiredoxin PRX1 n=1 Tax=Aspergillus udagawae TaxID=91492 RepID=A0ABQ1B7S6_9EURO|nr:mitochondrial peroxiredoxin PRX1 [Aspergillus udagawae]GFF54305.1 mitochondrial peroxiredoxin PRX1 [Aspergillus udagawae]GFF95565.1 mitochondrial peroxiredoxin PRX1 [Aspergillus udagawae]GFG15543.1 mitochondrial peroxiredoxin PRX1 [Aspergillus udagawae]